MQSSQPGPRQDVVSSGTIEFGPTKVVWHLQTFDAREKILVQMEATESLSVVRIETMLYQIAHLLAEATGTKSALHDSKGGWN